MSEEQSEIQNGDLDLGPQQDEAGRVEISGSSVSVGNIVTGAKDGEEIAGGRVVGRAVQPDRPLSETVAMIIRTAQQVYQELGPGFELDIYDQALALEFVYQGLKFLRGVQIDIYYRDEKVGRTRLNYVIEDVMIELKVKAALEDRAVLQTSSHLRASPYEVAVILNFGAEELEYAQISEEEPQH